MKPISTRCFRHRLTAVIAAAVLLVIPRIGAQLVNVAPRGTAYNSGPLWPGDRIDFLLDGILSRQIHAATAPDLGFNYTVDLGSDRTIRKFILYPRQDGCCPERLRNFRVAIHQDDGAGQIGAEVWGVDVLTGAGENAGSGNGLFVEVNVTGNQTGRWVKITALDAPVRDYTLQMTELQVYAEVPANEQNRALNALVSVQGALFPGLEGRNLVDGARGTIAHAAESPATGYGYTINLGGEVRLSSLVIYPRQDGCCSDRLSNYRVSLHKNSAGAPGPAVWSANLRTDGSNPGSGWGMREEITADLDPAGTFEAQYIVVQSLDDPVPNYALQIAELEAYGEALGAPSILVSSQPLPTSTGIGRTARFSVTALAVNGEADKLTYQWQRNQVDIPGATGAVWVTPPALFEDEKSKYRCVISYPGLASVTTDEAELRLNRALQSRAFSNRPLWGPGGWNVSQLVDGNLGGPIHGDQTIEPGFSYQLDLGAEVEVDEIRIFPRQDGCCPERLRNIRVSVHKDSAGAIGDSNWAADLYTQPGENAGSGSGVVTIVNKSQNPADPFKGQWIQILNLEDPVTPYAMQVTEVEVFGAYTSGRPLLSFVAVNTAPTGVPGRPVTLTAEAKVINGDPAKISYRWTRDGVVLPDSNTNALRTSPLVNADTTSIYLCILSYPGVADVISDPVRITFDYNYAKNQPARSNRPLWGPGGWSISQIADGNRLNTVHGDTAIEAGFAYSINLGINIQLERIDIYPRQDGCCAQRLRNLHVSLHQDANGEIGNETWGADILTESNAGSGAGVVVTVLPTEGNGDPQGSWLQILAMDDPILDYSLQLTEIEVYGTPAAGPDRPVLLFSRKSNGLELRWTSGALEAASGVAGPWAPVANATSPYLAPLDASIRFFRLFQ
jgi:hypothetical protein